MDIRWYCDMMKLPKPLLVFFLAKENRTSKIKESALSASDNSQRDVTCPHWKRGPDGDPVFKCSYHPDLVTCGVEPCINKRAS